MTLRLSAYFIFHKIDVFIALSQAIPRHHPFKIIGIVHGLDFFKEFHGKNLKKLKKNTDFMIENSNVVITTSNFLSRSIEKTYKINDVKVLNLGTNLYFKKDGDSYKNKNPYFLFVGSLKPSKNLNRIIKAFLAFQKNNNQKYDLLIIGGDFWFPGYFKELMRKIKSKNIKYLGMVPNKELPKYYRGAVALVSPSLYEGFGLPLVEAMKCGCPVIAGNKSAEGEVVGEGGILVDPFDYKKISNAMGQIVENNKKLRKLALKSADRFSWNKFAKDFYRSLNSIN
jgi:glycosyltransferase involved in cell wall biosynthesis